MLGSLRRAVGAEGLRHLDDRGRLPLAGSHHHHLPGKAGATGRAAAAAACFSRSNCLQAAGSVIQQRSVWHE